MEFRSFMEQDPMGGPPMGGGLGGPPMGGDPMGGMGGPPPMGMGGPPMGGDPMMGGMGGPPMGGDPMGGGMQQQNPSLPKETDVWSVMKSLLGRGSTNKDRNSFQKKKTPDHSHLMK